MHSLNQGTHLSSANIKEVRDEARRRGTEYLTIYD